MSYAIIIILLGLLILIHESGHLLTAKWIGIPIKRFSIGFGKIIWKFQRKETEYCISLIPIGGYVLPAIEDEKEFFEIPIYKRIIFTLGGPVANIIFSIILFIVLNIMTSGFSLYGIFIQPFIQTFAFLAQFISAIPQLFSNPNQISGIVGIVSQGSKLIGPDFIRIIHLSILLTLNLAVFNLLPFPILDGGKIFLYLLEKIHPKLIKLHIPLSIASWLLIIGLMIYVTILDVGRLI